MQIDLKVVLVVEVGFVCNAVKKWWWISWKRRNWNL